MRDEADHRGRNLNRAHALKTALFAGAAMAAVSVFVVQSSLAQPASTAAASKAAAQRLAAQNLADRPRPRILVTSDLEIDDVASLHRFFLYANEFDIAGLVSSSSRFHWAGDPAAGIAAKTWAGHDVFEQMILGKGRFGAGGGYQAVYRNLRRHDPRYPSPEELMSKVRVGNIASAGEMAKDTPGSELIEQALLDDDPAPLHLQAWGGTNTIAAALRSIETQYKNTPQWTQIQHKVTAKARLYIVFDQDATYKEYILRNWPDLYTIYNRDMFWSVAYAEFRDPRTPPALDRQYFGPEFMNRIVQGPLLQSYPLTGAPQAGATQNPTSSATEEPASAASGSRQNPPPRPAGTLASEGDSPAYWYVLNTGLRSDEDPSFGGWGGRFAKVGKNIWTDRPSAIPLPGENVRDSVPGFDTSAQAEAAPQTRWIPALQHDFLARAHWTLQGPEATNHEPVVRVTRAQGNLSVHPGQMVTLTAQAADPEGDALHTKWWHYREAGSYAGGEVQVAPGAATFINGASHLSARLRVPADAKPGDTLHVIAEVTDGGNPNLTRYGRFVLTVR